MKKPLNKAPSKSVRGDFFANFSMARLTFNQFRKANKISEIAAFFMVFKSCVGVGVFTFPYAFGKAGYIYASILCIIICYMTGYGMYSLANIASKIEKSKFGLKKMHNYDSKRRNSFLEFYLFQEKIYLFQKKFQFFENFLKFFFQFWVIILERPQAGKIEGI